MATNPFAASAAAAAPAADVNRGGRVTFGCCAVTPQTAQDGGLSEIVCPLLYSLSWLLSAFYYCKLLLPSIGRLDPRVPPGSVLLYPTAKRAPLEPSCWPERAPIARGSLEVPKDISRSLY